MSQAGSYGSGVVPPIGSVLTLTGNTGGPVPPTLGNINIIGAGEISVSGNAGTSTLTIITSGAIPSEFDADIGVAIPVGGVLNILGGSNINTTAAGNSVTVNLNDSIVLPNTISTGLEGVIYLGTTPFMQNYGLNSFLGGAGNLTLAVGTAVNNTGVGNGAMSDLNLGTNNTAIGFESLLTMTNGIANTALGASSLVALLDGVGNIAVGSAAGASYITNESSNIVIGNPGVIADNNTIRIGVDGSGTLEQDTCFVAGIIGNTVSNAEFVTIDTTTGQLGVGAGGTAAATSFDTDAGTATPTAGVIDIIGGLNINTSGATNVVTVNLNDTVNIAGNYILPYANNTGTSGLIITGSGTSNLIYATNNVSGDNLFLMDAGNITTSGTGFWNIGIGLNSLASVNGGLGNIAIGANACLNMTMGQSNIGIGIQAGRDITLGVFNDCIGFQAGAGITTGVYNTCIGYNAGFSLQGGVENIAIGVNTLRSLISVTPPADTDANIAIGPQSLNSLSTGILNTAIGKLAGTSYIGSESNNVILGLQFGTAGENNVIRIGNTFEPSITGSADSTTCYIGGIVGNTVSNAEFVTIDTTTGQLGTTAAAATSFATDSGSAVPAAGVITIAGGTNVTTSGTGSTVTINATVPAPITWQVVTGATNLVANNGYFVNGGSQVVFTLPVTAAVGDMYYIRVLDTAVGGWRINQNASQFITSNIEPNVSPTVTTVGVTGYVDNPSGFIFCSADLVCAIADTNFLLCNSVGLFNYI